MDFEELKEALRLKPEQEFIKNENGSWTLDLKDSNEYGVFLSKLSRMAKLEEDTESSQVNEGLSSIQYVNDELIVTLIANFENPEEYKVTVREI